jgi:plasmid stabilization system protein ParE
VSYWIHPEALDDLESAALYFASRVSVRIADEFLAEYERVIEIIQSNQRLGTPLGGEIREYQFTGFGYSLFYAEDEVLGPQIYAVANQSREPGYWAWRV